MAASGRRLRCAVLSRGRGTPLAVGRGKALRRHPSAPAIRCGAPRPAADPPLYGALLAVRSVEFNGAVVGGEAGAPLGAVEERFMHPSLPAIAADAPPPSRLMLILTDDVDQIAGGAGNRIVAARRAASS